MKERAFWRSPYRPARGCRHDRLIEYSYKQPPFNPDLPLGGFIIHIREFACADCLTERPAPHHLFRDGPYPFPMIDRPTEFLIEHNKEK
jgi:hypothetical protein